MVNTRRNRKSRNTRRNRKYRGGANSGDAFAPASLNTGMPTSVALQQGQQYADFHKYQHGGAYTPVVGGPYPGAVTEPTVLPADLIASAKLLPLNRAFDEIRGLSDQTGGRRKGSRKGSRKGRKGSRKGRKAHRKSHGKSHRKTNRKANRKNRKTNRKNRSARRQRGGLYRWGGGGAVEYQPMGVAESGKLLVPAEISAKAGLNPEWKLAEDPNSFAPRNY